MTIIFLPKKNEHSSYFKNNSGDDDDNSRDDKNKSGDDKNKSGDDKNKTQLTR